MTTLAPADASHLQLAQEFLKSGQHAEARPVLEALSTDCRQHPDVLEAFWEAHAQNQEWEAALAVAKSLCHTLPESETAWLCHACSLNELGRTAQAFDTLAAVAGRFPTVPTIPYNLACCACKLGRVKEGWEWLARAIEIGGRAEIKLMAFDDPDLAPLLDQICAL